MNSSQITGDGSSISRNCELLCFDAEVIGIGLKGWAGCMTTLHHGDSDLLTVLPCTGRRVVLMAIHKPLRRSHPFLPSPKKPMLVFGDWRPRSRVLTAV